MADSGETPVGGYYGEWVETTIRNDAETNFKLTKLFKLISDAMYPVGSVYISVNNTSPAILFGGTWVQLEDTFLLAAGSIYSADATKDANDNEIVTAQHGSADAVVVEHSHTAGKYDGYEIANTGFQTGNRQGMFPDTSSTSASTRIQTNSTGESGLGKNMPPYITVYMWRRTG